MNLSDIIEYLYESNAWLRIISKDKECLVGLLVMMLGYHSTFEVLSIFVIYYNLESYSAKYPLATGLDE